MTTCTDGKVRIAMQRLVDEAYAHLHETGLKSMDDGGRCLYGDRGCAFSPAVQPSWRGWLDRKKEGIPRAPSVLKEHPEALLPWARPLVQEGEFARKVQICHDSADDTTGWFLDDFDERLKEVCDDFDLTFPGDHS